MPHRSNLARRRRSLFGALLSMAGAWLAGPACAAVMISQVHGGGGNAGAPFNNDFVELHNSGSAAVDLAGWSIQYASAAGTTWGGTQLTVLSGAIPAGGYYLVQLAGGSSTPGPLPPADVVGSTAMSATAGKVALVNTATALTGACPVGSPTLVDFVGYGSTANCSENAAAPAPSNTTALIRASVGNGCLDSDNNSADFAVMAPSPRNSASPAQPCRSDGGGGTTPLEVRIPEVQGSGAQSPLTGKIVSTRGVVTKVTHNGFFIQDLTGDGNDATSDGIFVFTGTASHAAAAVGHLVAVTGTVTEFDTGATVAPGGPALTVTELTSVSAVTQLGSGYPLTPTVVTLPESVDGDLERREGMLVTLPGPFTVVQNHFQGRYGQLTLAAGGRLETPTNRHRPNSVQALALADENARRRIVLDDGSTRQNPNPTPYLDVSTALPRAGDSVGAITGVIDFGLATNGNPGPGDYKIHPTVPPRFSTANPREALPQPVGGNIKVASFNVLNFFTTFTDGTTADGQGNQGCALGGTVSLGHCRGANNLAEFERQRSKIVAAMAALDADVLGLMEVQNNGNVAVQNLVDALNARSGAGTYATVPLPAQGTGSDAIRVAMIYKPARLNPVGAAVSDPEPVNNRPTLAQTFEVMGERFTLLVNHFKSKGSCPAPADPDAAGNVDAGDGQGCWNAQRVLQARRLRTFVATLQATSRSNHALLIGDLNAYAKEDPIHELVGSGYVDEVGRFNAFGYSYVFDGAAGRLDHAIATGALSPKVTGASHWHINADETSLADYNLEFKAPASTCGGPCPADPYQPHAYRSSDHDPVVVGLKLFAVATSKHACRKDGWRKLYRADGSGFRSQDDCIQYVNTGK